MTDVVRTGGIDEPRGLLTINDFIQSAMEKGIFNVELVDGPVVGDGKRKDDVNGRGFNDGTEVLIEVHSWSLRITAYDPSCLIESKSAVRVEFMFEYPLVGDNVHAKRAMDQGPSLVMFEGVKLIGHSLFPIGITKSSPAVRGHHGE